MPRLISFAPPANQKFSESLTLPKHHPDSAVSYVGQDHRWWSALPVNPSQLNLKRKRNGYWVGENQKHLLNEYKSRRGSSQPYVIPRVSSSQSSFIDYNSTGNFLTPEFVDRKASEITPSLELPFDKQISLQARATAERNAAMRSILQMQGQNPQMGALSSVTNNFFGVGGGQGQHHNPNYPDERNEIKLEAVDPEDLNEEQPRNTPPPHPSKSPNKYGLPNVDLFEEDEDEGLDNKVDKDDEKGSSLPEDQYSYAAKHLYGRYQNENVNNETFGSYLERQGLKPSDFDMNLEELRRNIKTPKDFDNGIQKRDKRARDAREALEQEYSNVSPIPKDKDNKPPPENEEKYPDSNYEEEGGDPEYPSGTDSEYPSGTDSNDSSDKEQEEFEEEIRRFADQLVEETKGANKLPDIEPFDKFVRTPASKKERIQNSPITPQDTRTPHTQSTRRSALTDEERKELAKKAKEIANARKTEIHNDFKYWRKFNKTHEDFDVFLKYKEEKGTIQQDEKTLIKIFERKNVNKKNRYDLIAPELAKYYLDIGLKEATNKLKN
jgi:hypothetical protein